MHMVGIAAAELSELRLLFAIPNGGARHPAVAGKLKAEGVKAGVPDLLLPVARRRWNGLFIEMKSAKGRVSPAQKEWIDALDAQGYRCEVCYGAEAAFDAILGYLEVAPVVAARLRARCGMTSD
jgi:hypothetical protein